MVRLSLVNMYLHGFAQPRIHEYDTLTSEDRWNEYTDVILANPPFMSPKGGIRPHNRFSVKSKRSEVLFVDYMAEHLTPEGRAGIIVPEGIIFQSQNAHRQLRKKLVEDYLVAVISLPAGVFNPYSGVKTSILILDRKLAKQTDHIAFYKVENDGFDLGAQRREIEKNDLPAVQEELCRHLEQSRLGKTATVPESEPTDYVAEQGVADVSESFENSLGLIVEKEKIAADGEFNLGGERYRTNSLINTKFELVALADVCDIRKGTAITRKDVVEGPIPVIAGGQNPSCFHNESNRTGETVTVSASGAYAGYVSYFDEPIFASDCSTIKPIRSDMLCKFLFHVLKAKQSDLYALQVGMGQPHVYPKDIARFTIPLPPLEVQREIIEEIEGYQRVVDGARAVIDSYCPKVLTKPDWPMVEIGKACIVNPSKSELTEWNDATTVSFVPMSAISENEMYFEVKEKKKLQDVSSSYTYFRDNDILLAKVTPCFENGKAGIAKRLKNGIGFGSSEFFVLRPNESAIPIWIYLFLVTPVFRSWATPQMTGTSGLQRVPRAVIERYKIPLPSLETQRQIVAEIEAEQALVVANQELIELMEERIWARIGQMWETAVHT